MGKYLKGLTKKWHGLPIWAWAAIAGLVLYLGYRWYRNRNPSSANATPNSASSAVQTPDSSGGYNQQPSGDSGGGSGSFFPPQSDQPLANNGYTDPYAGLSAILPYLTQFGGQYSPPPQLVTDSTQSTTNTSRTAAVKASSSTITQGKTANPTVATVPNVFTPSVKVPTTTASGAAAVATGKTAINTQAARNLAGEATITPTKIPAKAPVTAKSAPAPVKVTQPSGAGAVKAGTAKKNTQLIRAV